MFANWAPPCRVLVENVSEWFSIFFLIYRCRWSRRRGFADLGQTENSSIDETRLLNGPLLWAVAVSNTPRTYCVRTVSEYMDKILWSQGHHIVAPVGKRLQELWWKRLGCYLSIAFNSLYQQVCAGFRNSERHECSPLPRLRIFISSCVGLCQRRLQRTMQYNVGIHNCCMGPVGIWFWHDGFTARYLCSRQCARL